MARVQIVPILEHLDYNLQNALDRAVKQELPGVEVDSKALYDAFVQSAKRMCFTWESVPDYYIEME